MARETSRHGSRGVADLLQEAYRRKPIEHSEALDEALCYGWIDSLVRRSMTNDTP